MARVTETKLGGLSKFKQIVEIGSKINDGIQSVRQVNNQAVQTGINQQQADQQGDYLKVAQENAKMNMEKWQVERDQQLELNKQSRIKTKEMSGDFLTNSVYRVLENASKTEKPGEYINSYFDNPDNVAQMSEVAQKGELNFKPSDINLFKKNISVAAPFMKQWRKADQALQQKLADPIALHDPEGAKKALAEYNESLDALRGIMPKAMAESIATKRDTYLTQLEAKNKEVEKHEQNGFDRAGREREAAIKANNKATAGDSKELRLNLNTFSSRKDVVNTREAFQTAEQGLGLLQNNGDKNEIVGLLKLGLAKAANGGRPTDKDVELVSPNPSIANKIKRWIASDYDNKALEIDADALSSVFTRMKSVQGGALSNMAKGYAKSRSKMVGVEENDFAQQLVDEAGFGGAQQKTEEPPMKDPRKDPMKDPRKDRAETLKRFL